MGFYKKFFEKCNENFVARASSSPIEGGQNPVGLCKLMKGEFSNCRNKDRLTKKRNRALTCVL